MKNSIPNLLFLLVFLFSISSVNAQERTAQYIKGDILVQTTPEGDIQQIVNDLRVVDGIETNIELVKEISRPMRIWLVHFNHNAIEQSRMLNEAYMHAHVSIAQVNHILKKRGTIPNDTQFNSQWQYVNTGQSGGTVDADIDADTAWDISTGGYTALGDTIVVCVIDGGIDLNHNDLTPNRWVNQHEIPNNGIDDDNNGYIDDYLGWNPNNNNDNIAGSNHGTAVAGIIGAKGDNGIGVAGINWNVKLMIVRGGGAEAAAIAAYSYPLVQRQMYNNSGGAEGAYVVATNASWGVDFGQPANAPLWCAMYDTLGKYGILNTGAGPNNNVNVDVVGDLPTACPSEYLITLTNMNHFDNKVTQAPIGPVTIDLGAPGAGTWTTSNGGSYSSFGGTSGATPHVTGSIGLLYSVDCEGFAAVSKANPALAAEMARDFILNNVDQNTDLVNNTTTGGRLNLYKAMKNAMDSCVAPGCLPPYDLSASNVIDTSALITWNALTDTTRTFDMRWRVVGDTVWNVVSDTLTSYQFTNLTACTTYELQIEMSCDSSTAFSDVYTFKTLGCCEVPAGLDGVSLSDSTAMLTWNSVFAANEYIVSYQEVGTSIWIVDTVATNSFMATGLAMCTEYDFRVQTVCDTGSTLTSQEFSFVSGCGACTQSFCVSSGGTQFEWVESLTIDGVTYQTGENGGYYQHEGIAFTLDKGQYTATVTPGFSGNPFGEYSRIWIDFNQDGDFADAGELVFSENASSVVTGTFSIPQSAMAGITRLRVVMQFNGYGGVCENNYFGETEDYCVEITNITACDPPSDLDTTAISTTSIDVDWTGASTATEYLVRYRIANAATWTNVTTMSTSYSIQGLLKCNQYEIQVASVCNTTSDTSAYSSSLMMSTECLDNTISVSTLVSDVKVFPNPMNNYFNVSMNLSENQDITIQLLNVTGQLMEEQQFDNLDGERIVQLVPSQSLGRGTYIVKVIADDGIVVRRIVK